MIIIWLLVIVLVCLPLVSPLLSLLGQSDPTIWLLTMVLTFIANEKKVSYFILFCKRVRVFSSLLCEEVSSARLTTMCRLVYKINADCQIFCSLSLHHFSFSLLTTHCRNYLGISTLIRRYPLPSHPPLFIMSLDGVLTKTTENYKKFYDYLAQNYSRFTNIEDRSRVCKELEEVIYMLLLLILAEDDDTTDNPNDIGMLYDTLKVLVQLYNNVVEDKKGSELLQHPEVHKLLGGSNNGGGLLTSLDASPSQQHEQNQNSLPIDDFYVGLGDLDFNPALLNTVPSIKSEPIKKEYGVEPSETGTNNHEFSPKLQTTSSMAEMFSPHSSGSAVPNSGADSNTGINSKDLNFSSNQFTASQPEFSLNQIYNQYFPTNSNLPQDSDELPDLTSGARLIHEKEPDSLAAIIDTFNTITPNNSNETSNSISAANTTNGGSNLGNNHITSSPHHGTANTLLANLDDHQDHFQLFGASQQLPHQFEPLPYNSDFEF